MINKLIQKAKNKKGFTLIELIVVIAILGILAAILIPRFTGMREAGNVSSVTANLRNLQNAAEMYATENNVAIATVTKAQALTMLGAANITGPGSTTYDMVAGIATATIDGGIPYPAAADANYVNDYSDIAS